MPIDRSTVLTNVALSMLGKRCGSIRFVSEAIPTGMSASCRRTFSAAARERSSRFGALAASAASIDREVSKIMNASASARTDRCSLDSRTGWAAAAASRMGTAASESASGSFDRSGGSGSWSWLRTRWARRSTSRNASRGRSAARASSHPIGVRKLTLIGYPVRTRTSVTATCVAEPDLGLVPPRPGAFPGLLPFLVSLDAEHELEVRLGVLVLGIVLQRHPEGRRRLVEQLRALRDVRRGPRESEHAEQVHELGAAVVVLLGLGDPRDHVLCLRAIRRQVELSDSLVTRPRELEQPHCLAVVEIVVDREHRPDGAHRHDLRRAPEITRRGPGPETDIAGAHRPFAVNHVHREEREHHGERERQGCKRETASPAHAVRLRSTPSR